MADLAIEAGIGKEKILIENRSTNTGENFRFTKKLLKERHLNFHSFIFVQKPYMERRVWTTFEVEWPDRIGTVTSPPISFKNYCNNDFPMDKVINIMVGDLQRIIVYGESGLQIKQKIPKKVLIAYEKLIESGYTEHLINNQFWKDGEIALIFWSSIAFG